jgi:di/tricarboxylate transporter
MVSLILIISVLLVLTFTRVKPLVVFAAALLINLALKQVSIAQILVNASNHAVVTLLLLLICSSALEKTSFLKRLGRKIISESYAFTFWRMVLLSSFASALLNNTAIVASLLSTIKNNTFHPASKLLLPLSYAAIVGGTITLVGTSTNLIVNSLWVNEGNTSLGFFDFSLIGLAITLACLVVLFLVSKLLPDLDAPDINKKEYFIEAKVENGSELIGKSIQENNLRSMNSLFLVEIIRNNRLISPVGPQDVIEASDSLVFVGDVKSVTELDHFAGLKLFASEDGLLRSNLVEVVIASRSNLVGKSLKTAGFRDKFDAAVVAIRRRGSALSGKLGEVELKEGDNLVLAVGSDFASKENINREFFLLSDIKLPDSLSSLQEKGVLTGFLLTIGLAAFQVIPLLEGLLYYLSFLVFARVLSTSDIKQKFPFSLWLLLTSALTLATGLIESGIMDKFTALYLGFAGDIGPYMLLIIIYLVTMILTECVTNAAAAALMFPIAYSMAIGLGVNPLTFVMAIAYAASASFLSPYGYQTNLMVFNTAGYTIKHFFKLGIAVSITYSVVALVLLPRVFPF